MCHPRRRRLRPRRRPSHCHPSCCRRSRYYCCRCRSRRRWSRVLGRGCAARRRRRTRCRPSRSQRLLPPSRCRYSRCRCSRCRWAAAATAPPRWGAAACYRQEHRRIATGSRQSGLCLLAALPAVRLARLRGLFLCHRRMLCPSAAWRPTPQRRSTCFCRSAGCPQVLLGCVGCHGLGRQHGAGREASRPSPLHDHRLVYRIYRRRIRRIDPYLQITNYKLQITNYKLSPSVVLHILPKTEYSLFE